MNKQYALPEEIGTVQGSKPRKLHWDNGEPQLSLLREDIAGTVPQRFVGCIPSNIYDPPDARPMMSFHDPHDIAGAQAGSLRRGMPGYRGTNPLNPRYQMLDGETRPQPMPTFDAERGHAHHTHPMLRRNSGASASAPNLHGTRTPGAGSSRAGSSYGRDQSEGTLRQVGGAVAAR